MILNDKSIFSSIFDKYEVYNKTNFGSFFELYGFIYNISSFLIFGNFDSLPNVKELKFLLLYNKPFLYNSMSFFSSFIILLLILFSVLFPFFGVIIRSILFSIILFFDIKLYLLIFILLILILVSLLLVILLEVIRLSKFKLIFSSLFKRS